MELNKTVRIIAIVTVSTLVTIFTPVESKWVPLSDSFVARSLLRVFPPSNPLSESESPSPAPAPGPVSIPVSPSTDIEIGSPADSISPSNPPTAEIDMDSPAPSPEAAADLVSQTAKSAKTLMNSPKNLLNSQPLLSPEIKTICGKTDFPPLCESAITPLLTAQLKPDASSVLVLAIQASINATKAATTTVEKVAAADCQELYDDAVTNLEDAVNAVKSRDIATVNTNLSAAMTDYTTCNDGFEESGEPNPLADVADQLTKMVSNCLAISTLIK
ncbi:hypothetical protein EUTSA_v10022426mg [Eutrema salsugineum]|uniref:Pectinesterase inhibitor domain-containing protein n=1 Tax=Eutrema salsugineum TaxID=72664 RepID=V4LFU7_EUTSA|nr:pectinesterase inhibitor 10 [Eutrema salsugineum]ESQ49370.1 hypothetical protein EUTSA_v10022426mg [Eutrema salsugineum]